MNSLPTASAVTVRRTSARRILAASAAGNLLEWFDFAIYGFFAVTIGELYFPSHSPTGSLMAALAVFGVAFVVRPAGGFVLGRFADRAGRKPALALSVLLMGGSTTLIAFVPTYGVIGVLAPIAIVLLRCLQGFSAGGEYASAATYLIEYAPRARRGLWSSVISATAALGVLLAGLTALAISAWLPDDQASAWGWRLPFLLAAPLSIVGLYMRLKLEDTPVYRELEQRQQVAKDPVRRLGRHGMARVALVFTCTAMAGLGFYYLAVYVVTHLTTVVGWGKTDALLLTVAGLVLYSLLCPLAGMVGDRIGRRRTVIAGGMGLGIIAVPCFLLIGTGDVGLSLMGLTLFAAFEALVNVMLGVLLVELFPPHTRVSGGAIGFNLAQAVIGGPGPLIAAALATGTGIAFAPAFYIAGVALIASVTLLRYLPETLGADLSERGEPAHGPAATTQAAAG
ncbi:MFS transporter [Streptomyces rhizosphaericus]|uniref:Putative proline/betaine transporter n=1 Tax=Streptomyces rhizosphaericus TaxID=114699 RepID=A0A6G4AJI8_9ACTN|nr:MFS transporter [Streptomyces rhizosphaericus]NEW72964.1 MHS family MFS transporter [Streptomyces rhizosphaericus]